jgi:hypothetical protein
MKRVLLLILLAAPLAACDKIPAADRTITAAEKEELTRLVDAAQAKADAFKQARADGLRRAWLLIEPNASGAPCAEKLPKPPPLPDEDAELSPADKEALDTARFRMNVVPAWAVMGERPPEPLKMMQDIEVKIATGGPRRLQFDRQSDMIRRLVKEGKYTEIVGRSEALQIARDLGSDAYWGLELNVVTAAQKQALYDASDTFEPGLLVGKAFLWSFKEGRVVCAAAVTATNQDRIKMRVNLDDKRKQEHQRLHDDLKNEAYRAAIDALKAVPKDEGAKVE